MVGVNENSNSKSSECLGDNTPSFKKEPDLSARVEFLEQRVRRLEEVCLELTQILSGAIKHIHSHPRR